MAAPAVFNIVPSRGPTSGSYVQVFGGDFRLPTIPAAGAAPTPAPSPSVEVLFDGVASPDVKVLKSNRLLVRAPVSPIPARLLRMVGTPNLTFNAAARTITRSAGSWLSDGFRPKQRIYTEGTASNDTPRDANGIGLPRLIASVSALVLTLDASEALIDEGPVSSATVYTRAYGEGVVGLTVRNLDDNGTPIPGEEVVVPAAYSYERVQLAEQSDFARLVRTLIQETRRQVIANVSHTTDVDYDDDTADLLDLTGLAQAPGIVLLGPDTPENRFYSINGPSEVERNPGLGGGLEVLLRREPHTTDVEFTVMGIARSAVERLNLHTQWLKFVDRNPYLVMDRDENDPSLGQVRYELEFFEGAVATRARPNNASLHVFTGALVLVGFDHEDQTGFVDELVVDVSTETNDVPEVSVGQTGVAYQVGPHPPGGCACP